MNIDELMNLYRVQLSHLFFKWKVFTGLYDSGQESIDALNNACPLVFSQLQDLLYKELFLKISKFTDPALSFGKPNLSLRYLIKEIEPIVDKKIITQLNVELENLDFLVKDFKEYRNKTIAHFDLATIFQSKATPLPIIKKGDIEKALDKIAAIANTIEGSIFNSHCAYNEILLPMGNNPHSMIKKLKML